MSNVLSRCSIAFLLSGPGMDVLSRGPDGSLGKKASSALFACGFIAAATLAAGLAVVVTWRTARERGPLRQVRGRSREVLRKMNAMIVGIFLCYAPRRATSLRGSCGSREWMRGRSSVLPEWRFTSR